MRATAVLDRLLGVVDARVGAVADGDLQLVRARCGGKHARTQSLPDLHRRQAHSSRGTQHQQRLPGREASTRDQAVVGGHMRHQKRRAFREREGVGHGDDLAGGHHRLLGIAARAHARDHALADRHAIDVGGHLGHDSGHLDARHERQLRAMLIEALDGEHIGEVDAGRPYADADGAGCQRLPRQVAQVQCVGRAQGLADHGAVSRFGQASLLADAEIDRPALRFSPENAASRWPARAPSWRVRIDGC